jgi:hypothetical protein
MDMATIRGRFDVLSPDEAVALGARIPEGFRKFYTRVAVNSVFQYEVLSPALEDRKIVQTKKIENSEGEQVVIAVAKSRRKLVVD